MLAFGLGAALPLFAASTGFASLIRRHQGRLAALATHSKRLFGVILISVALLTLTGIDKRIEASALRLLPKAWINLTSML